MPTTGRHRGLSTIYIKHNLFHQSKLGRDVELQKHSHCSLQVSSWRNASNYPQHTGESWFRASWLVSRSKRLFLLVICWLICRHEQTIDHVIAQTVDLFRQNFFITERLNHLRILDDQHTKSLYSPSVSIRFPANAKANFFSLAQNILSVFYANAS